MKRPEELREIFTNGHVPIFVMFERYDTTGDYVETLCPYCTSEVLGMFSDSELGDWNVISDNDVKCERCGASRVGSAKTSGDNCVNERSSLDAGCDCDDPLVMEQRHLLAELMDDLWWPAAEPAVPMVPVIDPITKQQIERRPMKSAMFAVTYGLTNNNVVNVGH